MVTAELAVPYIGRFAPSPTGPLHFGSLLAALASCLEARIRSGRWLVRIEDIDVPRCREGSAGEILRTLDGLGFAWDGEVVYQTRRIELYRSVFEQLQRQGGIFGCACTRRELADSALAPDGAQVYPGTCRNGLPEGKAARAWRIAVPDAEISFDDAIQGRLSRNLARDIGDFVLLRADGLYAYQLAVVVDDADQGVTHVVRGADLIESTPRQIHLQHRLGYATPLYAHLPVATNAAGEKLSKQTLAAPVDRAHGAAALHAALDFLGQAAPSELARGGVPELWQWALANWDLARVPRRRALPAPDYSR